MRVGITEAVSLEDDFAPQCFNGLNLDLGCGGGHHDDGFAAKPARG